MAGIINKAFSGLLIVPVRIYQYAISPFTPASCRHVPTCSEYTVQALREHGPLTGATLAANRISRCHPWGTEGFDPVPKVIFKKVKLNKKQIKGVKYYDRLKSKIVTLMLIPLIFFGFSCNNKTKQTDSQKTALVSIQPYAYFIEQIAGESINTMVLIPPGTTPHVYDPTPRQMAEISNVDIYFYNGNLNFEQAWITKLRNNYPKLALVNFNQGIELLHGHECNNPDHHHDHGVDPHTWLSPKNGLIIAKQVFDALKNQHPESSDLFEKNYQNLVQKINRLDKTIEDRLANISTNKFMIFHPSLSYFARDYGLEQLTIEFEGKEPSPSQLRSSIDIAKEEGIKVILIQKEFDMENARIVADEIDGEIVQIDPLSKDWAENLLDIAQKISAASKKIN